ncbi:respiratory nitrate reductase subunit gamma [Actinomadura rubrisoli]|uniref:Nitrate reductase-like protein NarX n=1 Tax=Actinomadura rubrisoli TaxID=2530368 RepID=A0A4R5CGK4_9ACTN|nr:respiratory nitrate reductase subunit gamma [Actinomadura rubrisoli]TDD98189.1 respiratory nitrate reductase subunit gamma [Actinomadura rubrisoli]
MTHLHIALWGVLPYLVLLLFAAGSGWRYRYDRFGITTRSSQLHESRLLRVASPLFHIGLLLVIGGHVVGLVIPESLTERLRIPESAYRANALLVGGAAGLAAVAGFALLVWRRLRTRAVRRSSLPTDRALYPVLAVVLVAGLAATLAGSGAGDYDYRLGVSVWFRSLFEMDPDVTAMRHAPPVFQVHTLAGMALFALWPFSRLMHAFAAPVGYLLRPYIVYRSRGFRTGARPGSGMPGHPPAALAAQGSKARQRS